MPPVLDLEAPAKLNLTLRVVGRRDDGYHLLDALTVFTDFGDRIRLTLRETDSDLGANSTGDRVILSGPFADRVAASNPAENSTENPAPNLAQQAITAFRRESGLAAVTVEIEKNIPVAAGLGGGSADAAAVLRGLQSLAPTPLAPDSLNRLALGLGADVPVCLAAGPARMRGIGEVLDPIAGTESALVLTNPGTALSSAAVFRAFRGPFTDRRDPPDFDALTGAAKTAALFDWLGLRAHNDLLAPALTLAPEIAPLLEQLAATKGVQSCGMSGSGATCFALFGEAMARAETLARTLCRQGLWAVATRLRAP